MTSRPKRVLFVCFANACRSQMAEGFARALGAGVVEPSSAGVIAAGLFHETVDAMGEVGIDISRQRSKRLSSMDLDSFDLIVTFSDKAHGRLREEVPSERLLHRPVLDPVGVRGSPEQIREMFALTRDDICREVEEVLEALGGGGENAS